MVVAAPSICDGVARLSSSLFELVFMSKVCFSCDWPFDCSREACFAAEETVWIGKVCVLEVNAGTEPSFFLDELSCDSAVDARDEADGTDPAVGPLEKVGVEGESLMGDIEDAKSLESDESFVRFFFRKPNVGMGWQKAERTV